MFLRVGVRGATTSGACESGHRGSVYRPIYFHNGEDCDIQRVMYGRARSRVGRSLRRKGSRDTSFFRRRRNGGGDGRGRYQRTTAVATTNGGRRQGGRRGSRSGNSRMTTLVFSAMVKVGGGPSKSYGRHGVSRCVSPKANPRARGNRSRTSRDASRNRSIRRPSTRVGNKARWEIGGVPRLQICVSESRLLFLV